MSESFSFTVGQCARLRFTTASNDGVLHDPATLTITTVTPSGVRAVTAWPAQQDIVRDTEGSFHLDVPISEYGSSPYFWRCVADAGEFDVVDALEGSLVVRKPLF